MDVQELVDRVKKYNYGIERIRDFRNLIMILKSTFNDGKIAPDFYMETPEDLIRTANVVPIEIKMPSLYPKKLNQKRWRKVLITKTLVEKVLDKEDLTDYRDSLPETEFLMQEKIPGESSLIEEEFEVIDFITKDFAETLFSHIQPINSFARKIEAIRTYESIRELRELVKFLFSLREDYFICSQLKYCVIPFTVNYENWYYNGIINYKGNVQFYKTRTLFFDGLQIQKIQQCRICEKFLWVAVGKSNVDKTCSEICARKLKNTKQNEKYNSNSKIISQDRKYRKKKKRFENQEQKIDKYTEKSFLQEFQQDKVLTNLYVAWTETVAALTGDIQRNTRENLREVSTTYPNIIFAYDIYKTYLPHLVKTQNQESNNIFRTEIEIPAQVYTYFVAYFRANNEKRLENIWLKASYSELKRRNEIYKNSNEENRINDIFHDLLIRFENKRKESGLEPLAANSEPFMALLANLEAIATACIKKIPIVAHDVSPFYKLPSSEPYLDIIDAEIFFDKMF